MIETDAEVQLHFLVYANHSIMNTKIRITGRENNFSDVAEHVYNKNLDCNGMDIF